MCLKASEQKWISSQEVAQSTGTTSNEVEVTSSKPPFPSYVDMSKKKKKKTNIKDGPEEEMRWLNKWDLFGVILQHISSWPYRINGGFVHFLYENEQEIGKTKKPNISLKQIACIRESLNL